MISDRPKATYDFRKDKLLVKIYENRRRMGRAAAGDIVLCIDMLLRTKEEINIIFAAAPSQNDVLASLALPTPPRGSATSSPNTCSDSWDSRASTL